MRRFVSARARFAVRSLLAGLAACCVLSAATIAMAQSQRLVPPEPSREPWISAEAVALLENAVDAYQRIVAAGGWPTVPSGATIRRGDMGEPVANLRRRLEMTGDLSVGAGDAHVFDDELEAAVKRYQMRNGIQPTGVVAQLTLRMLNVPAQTRLRQLELNLTRLRSLLAKVSNVPRYVVMNSASFELQAVAGGRVDVTSRTITGRRQTKTPNISATIQAINLLPYWHVPSGIARRAVLPAVRKNPAYLYQERIRVFSTFGGEEIDPALVNWWGPEAERYVFRQDPGPHNALGVIRFDMPNKQIVYLHDTPMKDLFGHFERAYSAGCVRTQNYLELAAWAVSGQEGWSREQIEAAIAAGRSRTIRLARPIPVHFVYLTAWVQDGVVAFRNDLYNQDETAFDRGEDVAERAWTATIAP